MSLRVSWRVIDLSIIVETSPRSSGRIHFDVLGPTGPTELVPLAVGINMYTEGDVLVNKALVLVFFFEDE